MAAVAPLTPIDQGKGDIRPRRLATLEAAPTVDT
jgi:hypothetical protein